MVKVKIGAITKEVTEGALKWYEMAGWKVIENTEKKVEKKETNTKKTTTT